MSKGKPIEPADMGLVILKSRANDLADNALVLFWNPGSDHHEKKLRDSIQAMKDILAEIDGVTDGE